MLPALTKQHFKLCYEIKSLFLGSHLALVYFNSPIKPFFIYENKKV